MDQHTWRAGDYAMHHMHNRADGTLVRLEEERPGNRFAIEYVPNGGGSSSWPADEFRPITDPLLLATAKRHKSLRSASVHEAAAKQDLHDARKWEGVIECLKEVLSAVAANTINSCEINTDCR